MQRWAPFAEFNLHDWDTVPASNLSRAFYVSRHVVPGMFERGSGKTVTIGSVPSMPARRTIAPYSASTGGLAMLTKGMAADLARFGIRVNAISPGYFATDMNNALWTDDTSSQWVVNRTPAQRRCRVEERVGTLSYLCSDASSFVSGQYLLVDGGMTAVV